jgi:hypothetical protein
MESSLPINIEWLRKSVDWKSNAEHVRSAVLYKSMDAIITAPLRPRQERRDYFQTLFGGASSNYERVAAGMNLVETFFPNFGRRVSAVLSNHNRFPIGDATITLMSFGSGSTVFRLKQPEADWVLKVYRRSLGKSPQGLAQIARHFKSKYETVCSWYNGRFDLVPKATFLIIYGHILGRPAAAVLQAYIQGKKSDLFLDHSNEELLALMRCEPELADRFNFFVDQTLYAYNNHNLCIDFLGRENLMLVQKDGRHQLLVVDNGIFQMDTLRTSRPVVYGQIEARLEQLRFLQGAIG